MTPRKLLILDLDETLVHASASELQRPADFRAGPWHVYRRPGLDAFLRCCASEFDLAVWTSSSSPYASAIVEAIIPEDLALQFLWARERCTRRFDPETWEYEWLKDLKKVKKRGYALSQVLMIDDTPEKLARHYGNLVHVIPFMGDAADDELFRLAPWLITLARIENVRRVEKRFWRQSAAL